jgi:general secretion pathway protein L
MATAHNGLRWPRDGIALRVPPRRLAGVGATCEVIAFAGRRAEAPRSIAWDALATALPRGARLVLLVAAEDVSFTAADVPALSGLRLREALPNLVEDRTVGEVGALHVALGQAGAEGRSRTLAVIDRPWLAAMQVHVVRAGHRVAAILPSSLAVPFVDGQWSLAATAVDGGLQAWLRTGPQTAMPLPSDEASAVVVAQALARQASQPTRIAAYADPAVQAATTGLASALSVAIDAPLANESQEPFAAWLAGDGPVGGYGPPLSLLASDGGGPRGREAWSRWRIAAVLALAIVAVQVAGMQWRWAGLRQEAAALRADSTKVLTSTFPATTVVLDAPLQMSRGLASLRAASGRSDPADFTMMMAASARIFAALPSNALHGADYDARLLKLRFAPGMATAADERERFVAAAAQEGYALAFDAAPNAAGEASATLRPKGTA